MTSKDYTPSSSVRHRKQAGLKCRHKVDYMIWLRASLSRISLATLLVMAAAAFAPTISNLLASQQPSDAVVNFGKGPLEICSADGIKQILAKGSNGDSRQGHQASKGHCPFCHLSGTAILGGAAPGAPLLLAKHALPAELNQQLPYLSRDGLTPPSRAPPRLTTLV